MAEHFGVYGWWRQDGRVVCVRKRRGPYTGQLDLPGGSPEPGEDPDETLARELREECGVALEARGPWSPFALHVTRSSTGVPIDFHHRGLIAAVVVSNPAEAVTDVEDVAAVELLDDHVDEAQLSPLLRHAMDLDLRR